MSEHKGINDQAGFAKFLIVQNISWLQRYVVVSQVLRLLDYS